MIDQRNTQAHWMCIPHPTHWWIQALQMVHGIGVRCEVDLPKQEYTTQMLPDIIRQMAEAIEVEKARVLQLIEENHKDALDETQPAQEETK
jgi:hypothetical protein